MSTSDPMIVKDHGCAGAHGRSGTWREPGAAGRSSAPATAPLVAVAHGSRDRAAQQVIDQLADEIRRAVPGLPVAAAFLQHAEPSLAASLAAAGPGAVIVPLLLSPGYHLETDIAAAGRAAGARVARPLGPDPLLTEALLARLAEAGVPAGTPVVLAAAGSTDPRAVAATERQAELLADATGATVLAGYAAAAQPTVSEAVSALAGHTGRAVAIASYLLAPGHFQDRLSAGQAAGWVTAPLGAHGSVARLVLARYRQAAGSRGRD